MEQKMEESMRRFFHEFRSLSCGFHGSIQSGSPPSACSMSADPHTPLLSSPRRNPRFTWTRRESSSSTRPVSNIVLVGYFGSDPSSELSLILLKALHRTGILRPVAVVANMDPAAQRALIARDILDELELEDVPVGVGTSGVDTSNFHGSFSERTILATTVAKVNLEDDKSKPYPSMKSGMEVLLEAYSNADDKSITVICGSSLRDLWEFFQAHEGLFVAKTKEVCAFGGAIVPTDWADDPQKILARLNALGIDKEDILREKELYLRPDDSSNNSQDKGSAERFYDQCQDFGVPLHTLSRHAADKVLIDRSIFDILASTRFPIAQRVHDLKRRCASS
jgi:hypothetical protein